MNYLELAKSWFPRYTTFDELKVWVKSNNLTPEEFKEVTGKQYVE